MMVLYNILVTLFFVLAAPLLIAKALLTAKYRQRFPQRLGFTGEVRSAWASLPRPRVWVHALSVGEVASCRSLVRGLRKALPSGAIIFSTTTSSGDRFARQVLQDHVDLFFAFPFDLPWVVNAFLDRLQPDLFVLVETDFWPNFLWGLKKRQVPAILVNGRISDKSLAWYRRGKFFFGPLFAWFAMLAMQTREDGDMMVALGVPRDRVQVTGNLKFDVAAAEAVDGTPAISRLDLGLEEHGLLWVAGSTHAGEEEIILRAYGRLRIRFPDLQLILAPRNIERAGLVADLAREEGLTPVRRTMPGSRPCALLILDTMGELARVYALCDVVFIGGSLVDEGGHNPLEPAVHGKPVLFGPHMEDFDEIVGDLLAKGAASQVEGEGDLVNSLTSLLGNEQARRNMGEKGARLVRQNQGATARHVEIITAQLRNAMHKGKA